MDLEIRRLKARLIACLNESGIPIEVKRYIMQDIYAMVEQRANEIVAEEEANQPISEEGEIENAEGT